MGGNLSCYVKMHPRKEPISCPQFCVAQAEIHHLSGGNVPLFWWWAVLGDRNNSQAHDIHLLWVFFSLSLFGDLRSWISQLKNSLNCLCLLPVIMRSAVVQPTASTTSWAWQEIWVSSHVWSNASASPETWTHLREDWMLCCKLLSARCVDTDVRT